MIYWLYMLMKIIFKFLCFFNQHVNSTYYKCFECGKHLKLNSCMTLRFDWLKEIDYRFTELIVDEHFYGLPQRYIRNPRGDVVNYHDLRSKSLIRTTHQSMMKSKDRYTLLIF